jgi:KDO2-lipid IV(A) lauroyltransferase
LKLFAIRMVLRVFSWITPSSAEFIAPPVGTLIWYLSPGKRHVTLLNLRAVYPDLDEKSIIKIARASMTHYVRGIFEAGMLWHWPLERVFDCFDDADQMELFREAQKAGAGVILAGIHGGAWELLGLYLQQHLDGAILYKPGNHPDVEEMLLERRRRGGARLVPTTSSGLRTMFKLLRAGDIVAMVPDQEPSIGEGEFAPFFGVEALTAVVVPRMAKRTKSVILFGTCERIKGGRYKVHVFKPDDSIYGDDMRQSLTVVNQCFEKCIEVDTSQYLWAYRRFRNRPPGEEKRFYRKT